MSAAFSAPLSSKSSSRASSRADLQFGFVVAPSATKSDETYQMRLGVWTPLPHTIRREPRMASAIAELQTHEIGPEGDAAFIFASDVIRRADSLGFDTTLVAARHLGPDPDAWILATALA